MLHQNAVADLHGKIVDADTPTPPPTTGSICFIFMQFQKKLAE